MTASYRGCRAWVLGGGGFIGRWVARQLSDRGADLTVVVRDPAGFAAIARRYAIAGGVLAADLARPGSVSALFSATSPDIVFNLAGYGVDPSERDGALLERINRTLVAELLEALGTQASNWTGLRLVHTGSALEYGDVDGNLDEAGPARPATPYGATKLGGTELVTGAAALPALTARLFTVYGPGEHPGRLLPSLLGIRNSAAPLLLTAGTQQRDFTYVADVAEGLLRLGLLAGPTYRVVNLATGKLCQVKDFALRAARVLHIPEDQLAFGRLPERPGEMHHREVRTARMRQLLGWGPETGIEAGIAATAAFLAEEPRRNP